MDDIEGLRRILKDNRVIAVVGLSYMLFRQIHFLVDVSQQQIERVSLWAYANYQLNLFTILSGPIQRYEEYDEQWRTLASALPTVADVVIQAIFPWCFTPEMYVDRPEFVDALEDFVRGRPAQPVDAFLPLARNDV